VNRLRASLLMALILIGAAASVRAAALYVCNKGTIPVEVVSAEKNEPFLGVRTLYWNIRGKTVRAEKCDRVWRTSGDQPQVAYIAFGFVDAKGQWGSGTIAHVPNFGTFLRRLQSQPVLVGATQAMCVRKNEYRYSVERDIPTDCAGMNLANEADVTHGPYVPLTAALYFEPAGFDCPRADTTCGDYYLNISPSATDRELHATRGSAGGAEVPAADSSLSVPHISSLKQFVDACNAFYGGPASSKYGMANASSWCACLGLQYLNVMTPDEESKYANDFFRLFHNGIAQPFGYGLSKTDPAWSRLHPAVDRCRQ
jgi:hypothetical protein